MFQKKLIASAVAGVAALSISSAAFANGGTYMAPVQPEESSFYFTAKVGYGQAHWTDLFSNTVQDRLDISVDDGNIAAGADVGYQFNRFLAADVGFLWIFEETGIQTWAVDVGLKMLAPLWEQFGLYASVGGSYLESDFTGSVQTLRSNFGLPDSVDSFNVTFGAGAYYEVTPEWVVEAGWQRYSGSPELNNNYQPFTDFYGVGLTYKFPVDMF